MGPVSIAALFPYQVVFLRKIVNRLIASNDKKLAELGYSKDKMYC